jgi:hypothetical protein
MDGYTTPTALVLNGPPSGQVASKTTIKICYQQPYRLIPPPATLLDRSFNRSESFKGDWTPPPCARKLGASKAAWRSRGCV